MCRFVVQTGDVRTTLFCAEPVRRGSSYCDQHHELCLISVEKQREALRRRRLLRQAQAQTQTPGSTR